MNVVGNPSWRYAWQPAPFACLALEGVYIGLHGTLTTIAWVDCNWFLAMPWRGDWRPRLCT